MLWRVPREERPALDQARRLPRYLDTHQERIEFERKLARILLETGEPAPPKLTHASAAGGDCARLRGLPAVAPGVGGAIHGTDPLRALLATERRRR